MITTLSGDNSYLRTKTMTHRIDEFLAEHGDFSLERKTGDNTDLSQLIESLQSLPFLASKKMVVLQEPSASKTISADIERVLEAVPDFTDLLIVESKFDKRSSLYKTLKKRTEFIECNDMDESALTRWLTETAQQQGASLSTSDARFLVQRVGTSQIKLTHELEKLLLYDPNITRTTIELLTEEIPQSTIFNLLDAAFTGNTRQAMRLYDEQRRQKVEPQAILAMVAWQLTILVIVKSAGSLSADEIARKAKLSPFVVRKSAGLVRNMSLAQLKMLVERTLRLDVRLKTESVDADEAIKNYLLELAES